MLDVKVGARLFFSNEERALIEKHLWEAHQASKDGLDGWRKRMMDNVGVVNRVIANAVERSHEPDPNSAAELKKRKRACCKCGKKHPIKDLKFLSAYEPLCPECLDELRSK